MWLLERAERELADAKRNHDTAHDERHMACLEPCDTDYLREKRDGLLEWRKSAKERVSFLKKVVAEIDD